ncbi:MAG: HEAT repeat domain-containing protein [Planctomycetota bacterium]|nr:HEAT repeat domain-containing protein [Planctomycetota bacterium]
MRVLLLLLSAAAFAHAGLDRELTLPPYPGQLGTGAAPGAVSRYAESLALVVARITADPADVAAWERLAELCEPLNRLDPLTGQLEKELERMPDSAKHKPGMRRLLGHVLVRRVQPFSSIRLGNNVIFWPGNVNPADLRKRALPHLRAAVAHDPRDLRSLNELEECLEALYGSEAPQHIRDELAKIKELLVPLRRLDQHKRVKARLPTELDLAAEVEMLLGQAADLEQREQDPDHEAAFALRKRALVTAFCSNTFPFDTGEALAEIYEPVSLLAGSELVQRCLTRTYLNRDGITKMVPPRNYTASEDDQRDVLVDLLGRRTDAANAALLALVRGSARPTPVVDEALHGLARANAEVIRKRLPALVEAALFAEARESFPPYGSRLLVQLAGEMRLSEAAPTLVSYLNDDRGLACPMDAARALGAIGRAEDLGALLAVARDKSRDVHFRRAATEAAGRIDVSVLAAGDDPLQDDPLLAIACAAARIHHGADAAARGALLTALTDKYVAPAAADICARLGLKEAVPVLKDAIVARNGDYASVDMSHALVRLRAADQ